jgi:hypothetical protein
MKKIANLEVVVKRRKLRKQARNRIQKAALTRDSSKKEKNLIALEN